MHRMLRQERNVRGPDAMQTEGFVKADGVLEGDQVFDQAPTDLPVIQASAVDAEGLGDHLEALRCRIVIEGHHMLD
ncbi:hypothetical protein D9M72_511340 [compost metagenome]